MLQIASLHARQILDSRGNPTVEVDAELSDGSVGRAAVPSGASTGSHESLELRDHRPSRYLGLSVEKAVANVEQKIACYLHDVDASQQFDVDNEMVLRDGTATLQNLGANAVLAVSLAVSKAAAASQKMPYYAYIAELYAQAKALHTNRAPDTELPALHIPTPMFNVLNGGAHTHWQSTDVQEFMLVPLKKAPFREQLRWCSEIYHELAKVLAAAGFETTVGDEGGFAPPVKSDEEALQFLLRAITRAGYTPGKDIGIGLDVAASQFWVKDHYELKIQKKHLSSDEMISLWDSWLKQYPIVLLEDGLAEDDWAGWTKLTAQLGQRLPLVGDDLLVTNIERIAQAIKQKACNSLLMKVNQIGTLSESLLATALAKSVGWEVVVSHRSGETEDTSIADIAVGIGADRMKAGAPAHSERTAKYNQLLRIEETLGL